MRYRPFGRSGMAISALSLTLTGDNDLRRPADWIDVVHAAFEEGVNAFELVRPSTALLQGFADAAKAVRRHLIFVGLRLDIGRGGSVSVNWIDQVIRQIGFEELNLLTLEASLAQDAPARRLVEDLKTKGIVRRFAVAGAGDQLEAQVKSGLFDAMVTPFSLLSGWRDRNLVRTAVERNVAVMGCDPFPPALEKLIDEATAEAKPGFFKRRRRQPLAGVGTYAFLDSTPGWDAEQICLSYALAEPSVATVLVEAANRKHLSRLAAAADRDLPSAVSAQIEMARFSELAEDDSEKRSA
jgi:aryl-alcohol dehydrogenase-like predicted oxidoreductase